MTQLESVEGIVNLVKHHYYAGPDDVRQALTIEAKLLALVAAEDPRIAGIAADLRQQLRNLRDALYARELGENQAYEGVPLRFLTRAVDLAAQSSDEDPRPHPKVGAVVLKNGSLVAEAFRNQDQQGGHAEQIALESLPAADIRGATVITTLEPCVRRGSKVNRPCAEILIRYKVARVMIGLLDPDPTIRGKADGMLRTNGIEVAGFPAGLSAKIWSLNQSFVQAHTKDDFQTVYLYHV